LHNNDKILQHVSTPPSGVSIIIRSLNPLKKEVRYEVKTSEKYGTRSGEGEFENSGQEPPGPQKRAPKFFKKIFGKIIGNVTRSEYVPPWKLVYLIAQ